jgi:hypothetical protein
VFVLPDALDRFPPEGILLRPLPYLREDLPVWSSKPGVNYLRTRRRMLEVKSQNLVRGRTVLVDLNISAFRHPEYLGASFLALASPETPTREILKWERVDKNRLTDEIPSEDLRSFTTIRLEEETMALNALTLFLYLRE